MSRLLFCGELQLTGLANMIDQDAGDRFVELEYRPSSMLIPMDHIHPHKELSDEPLNISYICAGGERTTYSLLFLYGYEHDFFLQVHQSNSTPNFQQVSFEKLFQNMTEKLLNLGDDSGTSETSTNGVNKDVQKNSLTNSIKKSCYSSQKYMTSFHDSREMKQIICNNSNSIVFEMMDGKLYLYDIEKVTLFPFIIPLRSNAKCIDSGIMSPVILVNDVWNDYIIALDTSHSELITKDGTFNSDCITRIAFPEKPADIKLMKCYCRKLFLFVLANNWLYVWGYNGSRYGFETCPEKEMTRITTGFENEGNIVAMDTGFAHVALLLDNGTVYVRVCFTCFSLHIFRRNILIGYGTCTQTH